MRRSRKRREGGSRSRDRNRSRRRQKERRSETHYSPRRRSRRRSRERSRRPRLARKRYRSRTEERRSQHPRRRRRFETKHNETSKARREKGGTNSIGDAIKRLETRLETSINSITARFHPVAGITRANLQRQDFLAAAARLPEGDPWKGKILKEYPMELQTDGVPEQ